MDVNGLIEFHRGDFKSNAFKTDLLDMCLGFESIEIDNLQTLDTKEEFIRHMTEETWWITD